MFSQSNPSPERLTAEEEAVNSDLRAVRLKLAALCNKLTGEDPTPRKVATVSAALLSVSAERLALAAVLSGHSLTQLRASWMALVKASTVDLEETFLKAEEIYARMQQGK
jgi:hypothetical protein